MLRSAAPHCFVFNEIKKNGDQALKEFTKKFDGANLEHLQVSVEELKEAEATTAPELKNAIEDVILNRSENATDVLVDLAENFRGLKKEKKSRRSYLQRSLF